MELTPATADICLSERAKCPCFPGQPGPSRTEQMEEKGEMYRATAFCPVFESLNFTKRALASNYGFKEPF